MVLNYNIKFLYIYFGKLNYLMNFNTNKKCIEISCIHLNLTIL